MPNMGRIAASAHIREHGKTLTYQNASVSFIVAVSAILRIPSRRQCLFFGSARSNTCAMSRACETDPRRLGRIAESVRIRRQCQNNTKPHQENLANPSSGHTSLQLLQDILPARMRVDILAAAEGGELLRGRLSKLYSMKLKRLLTSRKT